MTSKEALRYEEDQLEHFEVFINMCLENKVDAVFVAGNLFGTPKPKNRVIETAIKGFNSLSSESISSFILPGLQDMPLAFINDRPIHHILDGIDNVHFLYAKEISDLTQKNINKPSYQGEMKNLNVNLFNPSTPFMKLDEYNLDLETEEEAIDIFIVPVLKIPNQDETEIITKFLDKLNNSEIDILLLGGTLPESISLDNFNFQIVSCPQIHQSNFVHSGNESGLKIKGIDGKLFDDSQVIVPISKFIVKNEIFDIAPISSEDLDTSIMAYIADNADPQRQLFRLAITGEISKEDYQLISMFKFNDFGKRYNYYFEIADDLVFTNSQLEELEIEAIKELEEYTDIKINQLIQASNPNLDEETAFFKGAFERIKSDIGEEEDQE